MPDGFTPASTLQTGNRVGDSRLAERLRREVEGDVLFDAFERGRYSTDASIYQVEPIGIVRAKSVADIQAVLTLAREEGVTVSAARRWHLAMRPDRRREHRRGLRPLVQRPDEPWTWRTAGSGCGPAWCWGS